MNYPTTDEFDQETAKRLLENCATLIVDGFPAGCEFGIDLSLNYTADKFMGIKLIPPGQHFVYFSHVKQQTTSPRIGFFVHFEASQILCLRWNPAKEDLEDCPEDQRGRLSVAFRAHELDSLLGPYQYSKYQTWISLSDYITPKLTQRINPKCGRIFSASQLVYASEESRQLRKTDAQGLPEMVISPESRLRFAANIPPRFLVPGQSSAKQVSEHSMDSSFTLDSVIKDCFGTDQNDFLGELQYSFIALLLGQVFEAFEHWRDMMKLLCNAKRALIDRSTLFMSFIRVVHFQLQQSDQELFADIVENQNIMYCLLQSLFMNIADVEQADGTDGGSVAVLKQRAERFKENIKKTFKWSFEDEPEDERPVMVPALTNGFSPEKDGLVGAGPQEEKTKGLYSIMDSKVLLRLAGFLSNIFDTANHLYSLRGTKNQSIRNHLTYLAQQENKSLLCGLRILFALDKDPMVKENGKVRKDEKVKAEVEKALIATECKALKYFREIENEYHRDSWNASVILILYNVSQMPEDKFRIHISAIYPFVCDLILLELKPTLKVVIKRILLRLKPMVTFKNILDSTDNGDSSAVFCNGILNSDS